jgi:hypothetical protein
MFAQRANAVFLFKTTLEERNEKHYYETFTYYRLLRGNDFDDSYRLSHGSGRQER